MFFIIILLSVADVSVVAITVSIDKISNHSKTNILSRVPIITEADLFGRNGPGKNQNGPISIKTSFCIYSTCCLEVVKVFICLIQSQIMGIISEITGSLIYQDLCPLTLPIIYNNAI